MVEFVIVLDPSSDTLKANRGSVEGSCALLGTEDPTHPPAGAGAALSLLFLRVSQQVPGRLWRGGAHNSAQPPLSLSFHSLGKTGLGRFWKGQKQSSAQHQSLGSLPLTRGHRSPWHTGIWGIRDTDWHKKESLGLVRAAV